MSCYTTEDITKGSLMFDFADFTSRGQKILDHIAQDIAGLRTGRASSSILDPVQVDAYGTKMKVQEVANVTVPDSTMIMISPWDKSIIDAISKAISVAGLNLNPIVDGDIIRISIPPLTEETRREMVKLLSQKIEAGKVMLRNLRGDIRRDIEAMEDENGVSEDDVKAWFAELDKKAKDLEQKIEEIKKKKEDELMKI